MNVRHFSHSDMDGASPIVLSKLAFDEVNYTMCGYNNIDEALIKFLNCPNDQYDLVLITDISVNREVAERIEEENRTWDRFRLIDHHGTAEWLNQYSWAHVQSEEIVEGESQKTSATSLLYRFLTDEDHGMFPTLEDIVRTEGYFGDSILDDDYYEFAEHVRQYDTWEWETVYGNKQPKYLNDFFYLVKAKRFIERFTTNPSIWFDEGEEMVVRIEEERIQSYIRGRVSKIKPIQIEGIKCAVLFADQYVSELGNYICKTYPEYDAVIMIDMHGQKLSFRASKDGVDVAALAQRYGGGGHIKASGAPIPDVETGLFIVHLFNPD